MASRVAARCGRVCVFALVVVVAVAAVDGMDMGAEGFGDDAGGAHDGEVTQEMADAYLEEHAKMFEDMGDGAEAGGANDEPDGEDGDGLHADMTGDIAGFNLDDVDLDGDIAYEPVPALRGVARAALEEGLCYAGAAAAAPSPDSWGAVPAGSEEATRRCELDVVAAGDITPEEFQTRYVAAHKPCLVRGAGAHWPAVQNWRRDALLERYGDLEVKAGFRPPYFDRLVRLRDFMAQHVDVAAAAAGGAERNHSHMVWDDVLDMATRAIGDAAHSGMNESLASRLQEDMGWADTPVVEDAVHLRGNVAFVVGAACSGTHLHTHPRGFCMLVHGLKRWIIHEALGGDDDVAENPFVVHGGQHHVLEWFRHYYPKMRAPEHTEKHGKARRARVYECFQQPGDLIFIPEGWPHAVLNVLPSVSSSAHAEEDQGTLTRDAFKAADRDGDGGVTRAELDAYLKQDHNLFFAEATAAEAAQPEELARTVWNAMDKNKDGKITEHEMRDTWDVAMDRVDAALFPNYPKQPPPTADELDDPHLGELRHDEL